MMRDNVYTLHKKKKTTTATATVVEETTATAVVKVSGFFEAAVTAGVKATSEAEGVHTTVRVTRVATAVGGAFIRAVVRLCTSSSDACRAV